MLLVLSCFILYSENKHAFSFYISIPYDGKVIFFIVLFL